MYESFRAYPGSEFVVANTLAKLKKLKPNEINFTERSIDKLFCNCPLGVTFVISADKHCKQFGPDQARQNVGSDLDPNCLHPDGIEKSSIQRVKYGTINTVIRNNKSNIGKSKSQTRYTFLQICNFYTS